MTKLLKIDELSPEQKEIYDNICWQMQRIHAINLMAYEEMLKAADIITEQPRFRYARKNIAKLEEQWQDYYGVMKAGASKKNFTFLIDFGNETYRPIEKKLAYFKGCVAEYYAKGRKRNEDIELAAQLYVAAFLFKSSSILLRQIIEFYVKKYGMDFTLTFLFADMMQMAALTTKTFNRLFPRINNAIWDDTVCVNASCAIVDVLIDRAFFNRALDAAKEKNVTVFKETTINKLKQKYNVKTLTT